MAVTGLGLGLFHSLTTSSKHPTTASSHRIVYGSAQLARNYSSLGQLKGASTLIVLGKVTQQQTRIGSDNFPTTTSEIHVEKVLWSKGEHPQIVKVRQDGGTTADGTEWIMEDFPLFKVGERYLLFLTPSPYAGELYPTGAFEGAFKVDAQNKVNSYAPDEAAKGVGVNVHDLPLAMFENNVNQAPTLQ